MVSEDQTASGLRGFQATHIHKVFQAPTLAKLRQRKEEPVFLPGAKILQHVGATWPELLVGRDLLEVAVPGQRRQRKKRVAGISRSEGQQACVRS